MNWMKAMSDSIDYIEDHLETSLQVKDIAGIAIVSPFYYQRMFSMLTNMSVQEYIRKRRMTLAANLLISSDIKIIDLAFKYGYESSEAFSRAFKSVHDASPTAVRQGKVAIKAFLKLTIQVSLKGDVAMNYKIEKKPSFDFYGITRRFTTVNGENFKKIPLFWQESMQDGSYDKMIDKCSEESCLGVCMPMNPDEDVEFDYLIGAFGKPGDERFDEHTVPEAEWAVFLLEGPMHSVLQDTWKRIFSEWFPTTGFRHANLPEFEVYLGGDVNAADYKMEIWIPIER